jgi:hypothetical protein
VRWRRFIDQVAIALLVVATGALAGSACVANQPALDTGDPGFPLGPSSAVPQQVAYTQDLQNSFLIDCVSCHNSRDSQGNYSMSAYADVMKDVRVGDASSKLVVDTQPGGSMYRYFSGDQQMKAAMVFRWVVVYGAAQSR